MILLMTTTTRPLRVDDCSGDCAAGAVAAVAESKDFYELDKGFLHCYCCYYYYCYSNIAAGILVFAAAAVVVDDAKESRDFGDAVERCCCS